MTIDMQGSAVFNNPEVVHVYPVFRSFFFQHLHNIIHQLVIGFVHDAGYRIAHKTEAGDQNKNAESAGDEVVENRHAGEIHHCEPDD